MVVMPQFMVEECGGSGGGGGVREMDVVMVQFMIVERKKWKGRRTEEGRNGEVMAQFMVE